MRTSGQLIVSAKLSMTMRNRLECESKRSGKSFSEVLRSALGHYFAYTDALNQLNDEQEAKNESHI